MSWMSILLNLNRNYIHLIKREISTKNFDFKFNFAIKELS